MIVFDTLIGIAVIVLLTITIVKFFQMASDIKTIKNIQLKSFWSSTPSQISPAERSSCEDEITGKCGQVTYSIKGNNVEFSDGVKGKIFRYDGFGECSIITDDNLELMYKDIYYAVEALYAYRTGNTVSKNGFIQQQQFAGVSQ